MRSASLNWVSWAFLNNIRVETPWMIGPLIRVGLWWLFLSAKMENSLNWQRAVVWEQKQLTELHPGKFNLVTYKKLSFFFVRNKLLFLTMDLEYLPTFTIKISLHLAMFTANMPWILWEQYHLLIPNKLLVTLNHQKDQPGRLDRWRDFFSVGGKHTWTFQFGCQMVPFRGVNLPSLRV